MAGSQTLEDFITVAMSLRSLLSDVGDAQWQAGKTPVPREDTTERSRGLVSDPTPSIVADGRRIELRASVLRAETALNDAAQAMTTAGRELTEALARWQG